MSNEQLKSYLADKDKEDNEIDLITIYRIIQRNKSFIFTFSIAIFLISCIYSLVQKRVFEGQFEIVISQNKKNTGFSQNQLQNLINFDLKGSNNTTLNTEVGILKSPSVLMPIFDFVNNKKSNLKEPQFSDFSTWQNKNLSVNLRKKTSILNIKYRDTNKELIIPVLQEISLAYQNYTGIQKNRMYSLTKDYLEKQISIYKEKSSLSKKLALEYAIDNNLSINDIETTSNAGLSGDTLSQLSIYFPVENLDLNNQKNTNSNSLENIRVNATNEINKINYQISKLENLDNIQDIQFMGSTMDALVKQGLPQILEDLETKLISARSKYKENDISVQNLVEQREIYAKLLKEKALGYLKAKRIAFEAQLDSAKRPKGVIIKGKELMREANRDEETLVTLENNLRNLELVRSKQEDPWKLITKPTIKQFPVEPNRRKIALIGIFAGIIISSAIAYYKERLSGKIYEQKDLERIFELPVINNLNFKEKLRRSNSTQMKLTELRKFIEKKPIFVVLDSQLINEGLENLKMRLNNAFNQDVEIISSSESLSIYNSNNSLILITTLGNLTFDEANEFKKRTQILDIKFEGIILT